MFDKIEAGGSEPPTKQFWVPVTFGTLMTSWGYFPVCRLAAVNNDAYTSFYTPDDFHSITEAYIVVIPRATVAATWWNLDTHYGAVGEAYNTHAESDHLTTHNVTNNQIFEVDISGVLTSLAAGDYVGATLTLLSDAHDVDVLGVMFRYD